MNYPALNVDELRSAEAAAARCTQQGVYVPAAGLFVNAFIRADGDEQKIARALVVQRDADIRRMLKHADAVFDVNGIPTPRHWQFIWLAYSPRPKKLLDWFDTMEFKALRERKAAPPPALVR